MMKEGWVYKKLGSVTKVVSGSTPKTNIKEYWGGSNKWVTPAELNDRMFILDTKRTITDKAVLHTNLNLLPVGTVLLSSRAPIGKVAIVGTPMYCNQGFKNLICSDLLYNLFLYWFLKGKKNYLNSLGRGATFKEISKNIVESILIPLPELSEQKKVVNELEKLNEILTKKYEQLKELDRLGQAVFYDMFGDPLYNERYTKVEKLGNVCLLKAGKAIKAGELISTWKEGLYPCYGGNGIRGFINKYSHVGDYPIIGRQGALCGNVNYAQGQFYATEHAVVVSPLIEMNTVWLYYVLNSLKLNEYARGVAQPGISVNIINNITMPIFNINTQIQFAKRIECVESQKQKIKQSIVEVQQLLDYTMNKYFG